MEIKGQGEQVYQARESINFNFTINSGLQLTSRENKLFGIIRTLDDPDAFLDRVIQEGVGLLQTECGYRLDAK